MGTNCCLWITMGITCGYFLKEFLGSEKQMYLSTDF
nr:MAG TPA: hypothetical protein [Caudoviricetes sp.]